MNTDRSEKKATQFLESGNGMARKTQTLEKRFSHPPEKVFHQFCPSRELDWIDGWECDLVYTTTGYAEDDCIFTTPESNLLGPGLWIFTRYEPSSRFEAVRIIESSVVLHFRIALTDNGDGTCRGVWTLTFTALNQQGCKIVESLPERSPELERAVDSLEHYLTTGEMMAV